MSERGEDFLEIMGCASRARVTALESGREALFALAARTPRPLPWRLEPPAIVAEIKPRAPSAGALGSADPARALAYAAGGAACVSVLTEPTRFDGSLEDLARIAEALRPLGVPAMRKDFLVDPVQLAEARIAGASGALLVVRMLDDAALDAMTRTAASLGLFVLLEAFDEEDLARAAGAACGTALVGVNARDLRTLAIDPERHARLAHALPKGLPSIAESGITTAAEVQRAIALGYAGALVGTALMRASDPSAAVRALRAPACAEGAAPCA
ncbi:MAG: indole-3-glycerol-phosphate synthase [Sandaracinus sp.]